MVHDSFWFHDSVLIIHFVPPDVTVIKLLSKYTDTIYTWSPSIDSLVQKHFEKNQNKN